jgi:adenine-specific DNA-methyltransferase
LATGVSKNKWTNHLDFPPNQQTAGTINLDVNLSYQGKTPVDKILAFPHEPSVIVGQIGKPINRLYYGDNLPILLSFLDTQEIIGKVKLIYIDPPFATKSIFQSRSQTDAYRDLLQGSHYLEFLRQRLICLREVLADDGSIYIHLDENMAFYVKIIMDEIFGNKNFRNWITRRKCNPKNYTKKVYGNISDYLLFYTKSDQYIWNRPYEKWTEQKINKEYNYVEKETGRRYKKVPIHALGIRNGETGKPWRGMNPPLGKHWQFTPEKLEEMDKNGEIFWSRNGNPRRKVYLDNSQGIPIQDIWLDFPDAYNQNIKITGYPTEKNPEILQRIIQASSNTDDLVLDCFSGSGTTLVVADSLQRRWIGIDYSCEAITTTLKRFTEGSQPMGDFVNSKIIPRGNKQLCLFENSPNQAQSTITNFTLYSLESCADDLNDVSKLFRKTE